MHPYVIQWRRLIQLAWPILLAQLSITAMSFVDTVMAGNYSQIDLAAIAIGGSLWLPTSLGSQALLYSIGAIAAQHFGAKRFDEAGNVFQQGLWLALLTGLFMGAAMYGITQYLGVFGINSDLLSITQQYLIFLCFAYPAATIYQALRSFIESSGKTRPIMFINMAGLLANIPLNYLFIYGELGPLDLSTFNIGPMGGAGCGLASCIVFYLMAVGLALYIKLGHLAKTTQLKSFITPKMSQQLQLIKLGTPMALSMFVEVGIFAVIAIIIAPLGVSEIAGHQVALSFSSQTFMLPLSLSMALSIHIGHLIGAGDKLQVKQATQAGLILALFIAFISFGIIALLRQPIAEIYTQDAAVIQIATQLLFFAAIYQWPDALQICAFGILRAYKITTRPLIIVIIAFWMIALPLGYTLGLTDHWQMLTPPLGAKGLWIGLFIGLSIAAVLSISLLWHVNHKYQNDG